MVSFTGTGLRSIHLSQPLWEKILQEISGLYNSVFANKSLMSKQTANVMIFTPFKHRLWFLPTPQVFHYVHRYLFQYA